MSSSSAATPLPPASLIICSRNRPGLLIDSVRSVLQGTEIPAELVIVDQSDQRNLTLERLQAERGCDIRYIWSRSVGLSRANNLGISTSRHDILVFTHDDVLVSPDWFGSIVRALEGSGGRSVVTGQVRPSEERAGGFQLTIKVDAAPAVYTTPEYTDVLLPLNMAMYRSTVDEIGVFDVRLGPGTPFPGAEDCDLGYRLLGAGYRICYVPQAIVFHRAWRPAHTFFQLRWSYGLARGGFYAKYLRRWDRHILRRTVWDIRVHCLAIVHRVRRDRRRALGDAMLVAGILVGAMRWALTQPRSSLGEPLWKHPERRGTAGTDPGSA